MAASKLLISLSLVAAFLVSPVLILIGYWIVQGFEHRAILARFEALEGVRILEFRDNNEEPIGAVEVFVRLVRDDGIEMEFWDVQTPHLDDASRLYLWSFDGAHPVCQKEEGGSVSWGLRTSSAEGTPFASLKAKRLEDVIAKAHEIRLILAKWPRSFEERREVQLEGGPSRCWLEGVGPDSWDSGLGGRLDS
ncbi:MAG: hypothetical protein MJE66_19635 [Proteobacteria bacterium]|nr:hypothetical protein [Pseudomonadota bacterium]